MGVGTEWGLAINEGWQLIGVGDEWGEAGAAINERRQLMRVGG